MNCFQDDERWLSEAKTEREWFPDARKSEESTDICTLDFDLGDAAKVSDGMVFAMYGVYAMLKARE